MRSIMQPWGEYNFQLLMIYMPYRTCRDNLPISNPNNKTKELISKSIEIHNKKMEKRFYYDNFKKMMFCLLLTLVGCIGSAAIVVSLIEFLS